jgi:hypothetical protein
LGAEWVSELSTHNGVEEQSSAPYFSYQKLFEEQCPYYMSIGMTCDEFWYGDPNRAKYYRKAYELKKKQINEQMWLQGLYVYEAICDIAPVLVTIPSKNAKIQEYSNEPYALTVKEQKEREQKELERRQKAMMNRFGAMSVMINQKFKKGGDGNG